MVQAFLNLICQQLVHGSNSALLYHGHNSWWTWINQPNVKPVHYCGVQTI